MTPVEYSEGDGTPTKLPLDQPQHLTSKWTIDAHLSMGVGPRQVVIVKNEKGSREDHTVLGPKGTIGARSEDSLIGGPWHPLKETPIVRVKWVE